MHSKELIGVIPNEELLRLQRQDIAQLIKNGTYPEDILRQLIEDGGKTPLKKLLQRGQGTSSLPIR